MTTSHSQNIKQMIDSLYRTIGIRMNIDMARFDDTPNKENFPAFCKVIISHMELPIKVITTFSGNFISVNRTGTPDGAASGPSAQISIPSNLPQYGTGALVGFPINLRVDPESFKHINGLLTLLSHEFSHVYLFSHCDPLMHSEHATDLCALMTGFTPFWKLGRSYRIETKNHSYGILTQGYLSDDEYNFAVEYIENIRARVHDKHLRILTLGDSAHHILEQTSLQLSRLTALHSRLQSAATKSASPEAAKILSEISRPGFMQMLRDEIENNRRQIDTTISAIKNKRVFTEDDCVYMDRSVDTITRCEQNLSALYNRLRSYVAVIMQGTDLSQADIEFQNNISTIKAEIAATKKIIDDAELRLDVLQSIVRLLEIPSNKGTIDGNTQNILKIVTSPNFLQDIERSIESISQPLDKISRDIDNWDVLTTPVSRPTSVAMLIKSAKNRAEQLSARLTHYTDPLKRALSPLGKIRLKLSDIF